MIEAVAEGAGSSSSPLALSYSSTSSSNTSSSTETSTTNKSSSSLGGAGQTFTLADLLKNSPPSINTSSRLPPRVDNSVILGTGRHAVAPHHEHQQQPQQQLLGLGDNTVDEMYNSLRQLSSASAINKYVRMRKVSQSSIPFTNVQKDLTVTMNEIYYTSGKPPRVDGLDNGADEEGVVPEQEVFGQRKDLYKKKVKSIGTSLKNCVQSDVISIDIDPESTRLPLMCKLMIIVEGAAYERGIRVLVRDAGVQVDNLSQDLLSTTTTTSGGAGEYQINQNNSSNNSNNKAGISRATTTTMTEDDDCWSSVKFRNIPIQIEKNDFYQLTSNNNNNKPNKLNSRYRSSECINYDAYNQMHQDNNQATNQRRRKSANLAEHLLLSEGHHRGRNLCGGSLNGLDLDLPINSSSCSYGHDLIFDSRLAPADSSSNYFKRKANINNNSSNLIDNRADSYLDLLEYISTPYYQYQKKNIAKKDFGGNTIITYSYMSTATTQHQQVMTESDQHHETAIELFIPIKVSHQTPTTNIMMTPTPPSSSMSSSSEEPSFYSTQLHRNEKQFFINDNLNENLLLLSKQQHGGGGGGYQDPFEAFRRNMKRFIQERLNRFEAEITLTNRNNGTTTTNGQNVQVSIPVVQSSSPKQHHQQRSCSQNTIRLVEDHPSILSFREINDQLNSNNFVRSATTNRVRDLSYNHRNQQQQQQQQNHHLYRQQQQLINDSSAQSVTNLMYMKVVDGQLIE